MNRKKHLPLMGVGSLYVASIVILTAIGIGGSTQSYFRIARIRQLHIPFVILGSILVVFGMVFWKRAAYESGLEEGIMENRLVTTGVYAYVRNPIYSALTIVCIGALFIANNLYLLILPFIFWGFMTVLMKYTEEKWLTKLYGQEYIEYCKRVNRCIPWFSQKIKEGE